MGLAAAAAYPIGGLIGWLVVEVASDTFIDSFIGALFGVTGGIMLYIAFVELLPTAIMTAKRYTASSKGNASQYKRIYVMSIAGIFIGFLVMDISTILLAEAGGHSHLYLIITLFVMFEHMFNEFYPFCDCEYI